MDAAGSAEFVGYPSIGLVFVGLDLVPSVVPIVLGGAGAIGLLTGLAGWANEAFIADYLRNRSGGDSDLYATTMILFLVSDVATFSAGFVYYAFIRAGSWPPAHLPPLLGSLVVSTRRCCLLAA